MAQKKVDERKIMEIYNTSGSKDARDYINKEYNIAYPSCVISRLRLNPNNGYDKAKDKFQCIKESPFLNLDELLCSASQENEISLNKPVSNNNRDPEYINNEFNKILQNLAMEKLMEITKYISLNHVAGHCKINKKALTAAGYWVEIF